MCDPRGSPQIDRRVERDHREQGGRCGLNTHNRPPDHPARSPVTRRRKITRHARRRIGTEHKPNGVRFRERTDSDRGHDAQYHHA